MKTVSIFAVVISIALLASCKKDAVPVDISKICSPDNEKKYVVTSGQLDARGSVFCSNTGGRMDCGLDVMPVASGPRVFGADIEQGSGANEIEKLASGYKREDIKIHDNAGKVINLGDKVTLTGQMSIGPGVCFMKVDKIDR
jgi:hypothetical protein